MPRTGPDHSLLGEHDKGTTEAFRNGDKTPDGSQNREKDRKAEPKNKTGKAMIAFPVSTSGAAEESRTLDLNLGKVALYQLSYCRFN
jgi:hypothetical protein